ncbi:SpaA isopeptide-forming pilin-related protein [Levilactobacillus mulengensis]|uniref:SpaA isopeptide-forming pilin-related protein n=1 Tax=Levilactobacillus mulengensis TaxID=2486025 RepID=UPI0013DD978E|nr:SpaA isopeptide-forming pilin-related protein [Levilactobacillus mulengensis]
MKKLLAIIAVLGCVLGLTSYLRIQAQDRNDVIEKATLQDQTGRVVKKLTSHQAQDLQVALTVKLPAGETMVTLADQDNAKLMTGEITVDSNQEVTAMVDQKRQLIFKNDQSQDQTVDLVVPVKVTPAPLSKDLQLKLNVADPEQEYELEKIAVVSKEAETETKAETGEADAKLAKEKNDDTKKAADETSDTKTEKKSDTKTKKKSVKQSTKKATTSNDSKTTKDARSNQQTTGKTQSQKSATTDSEEDVIEAEEDEAVQARMATTNQTQELPNMPTESVKISRGQVQMEQWSDKLLIGGTLLEKKDNTQLITKVMGQDGISSGGYYGGDPIKEFNYFETRYHSSYQKRGTGTQNGEIAYAVAIDNQNMANPSSEDTIVVYYDNVGMYTTSTEDDSLKYPMGVIVEISDIKYHTDLDTPLSYGKSYIDFSNNFYSGLVYKGIESFNIDMTFTNSDWSQALEFPKAVNDKYKNYFTFGSLNGRADKKNEWAGTRSELKGELSPNSKVEYRDHGWYEGIGIGLPKDDPDYKDADWGDYLGSADYERGAVSFPMVGTTQLFKLKSQFGFTWQSFSSGFLLPLEQPEPHKTVHSNEEIDPKNNDRDGVTIDRDKDDTDFLYYTIYQPTYNIPNDSIAKPNAITMWDQLPAGVTVEEKNINLFNTDGTPVKAKRGEITIVNGKVTYKLSKEEIEELIFDGNSFAIQMMVKLDSDFVGTLENEAEIEFDSGTNLKWPKKTNKVITHYFKGVYQFEKIDSTTKKLLTGAEFIIQDKAGNYLKFDTNGKRTGEVADKNEATVLKGDDNGNFKITGLKTGTYTLIETKAPDGYTIGEPTEFTISKDKQTGPIESKQVENDPEYSLPITGGQGIIWFIIVGLMLTLSALAIWRTHPRGE